MKRQRLDEAVARRRLASLDEGWSLRNGHLHRLLSFPNFREAFAFMTRVAALAERLDHHPNWSNVYGTVEIELHTHVVDGLTDLDFDFATAVDQLLP